MATIVIIIASLITDVMLGGMAYKMAKSQDKSVKSLERIAESLDKRVSTLEARNVVVYPWSPPGWVNGIPPVYLSTEVTSNT